jgi:DNA-binding CsgD family transcriptional regulator
MGKRTAGQALAKAKAVARTLAPAGEWREQLAAALLEVPGVVSSWVFTCPPGFPYAANGVVLPESAGRAVGELFFHRDLPSVERDELSLKVARRFGDRPFPGLSLVEPAVAERARRELLAPIGAADVIPAFVVVERELVVGWLSLCVDSPAEALLSSWGPEVAEISALVSAALAHAMRVAEDCGVRAPRFASFRSRALSARELEVARLVGEGCTDLNVAHRLRISEHTVAAHLRSVFSKLELHSRAELAAYGPLFRGAEFTKRSR